MSRALLFSGHSVYLYYLWERAAV